MSKRSATATSVRHREAGPELANSEALRRALVGLAPDDVLTAQTSAVLPLGRVTMDRLPGREYILKSYLEAEPQAAAGLEQELSELWARADGLREAYLTLVAEKRAQLLSRAELHHASRMAPAAMEELVASLEEYLSQASDRTSPPGE
jgi:hypothetical protein